MMTLGAGLFDEVRDRMGSANRGRGTEMPSKRAWPGSYRSVHRPPTICPEWRRREASTRHERGGILGGLGEWRCDGSFRHARPVVS